MREVNNLSKKNYYIVEADALPEVFGKVVKAKDLIESGAAKNISSAIKMCGLSRSAFYKYKDCVFKAKETNTSKAEFKAVLVDRAGVFSSLSNALFKSGANIVTMNQTEPENGVATVSIVIGTDNLKLPVNEIIKMIERLDGVISVKNI